ncbi:DUF4307 domain-containing protein [Aeromicrobium sp. IC_218]|uniref:DUF4307 domain-containing protein n=1 Tax=Aeromicrobium sp. IC_218 TaxID=2545468 RepID=UPI0013F47CD5|nr:DUF4307 domain-containing protein [Aeromicrobium sp. IC_218]
MTNLDARYGRRSKPAWFWWAFAAVGIVLGIAWAAWVATAEKPVSASLHSYDVVSDTEVVVRVDVVVNTDDPVECTVYAQNMAHAVVGEKTVRLDSDDREQALSVAVRTQERAVNGVLRSCRVAR